MVERERGRGREGEEGGQPVRVAVIGYAFPKKASWLGGQGRPMGSGRSAWFRADFMAVVGRDPLSPQIATGDGI